MTSLTPYQRRTAIAAIIHMEGTDGSNNRYGPTLPEWGGKGSALSYGYLQNDVSEGENKYDITSNSQALLETLENYNYDRTPDKKLITYASTPAGADAIVNATDPTDREYYDLISSALSAPENLPIWQAQDMADEKMVIDRLNEAINYINENNPDGAGDLSWSHLDPKALMSLAAWTNQHPNIMPMIEALTANASSKKPLKTDGLLDAIVQQPYFNGPKAYDPNVWKTRIDETVRYVNRRETSDTHSQTTPGDPVAHSAAKPIEPAPAKPGAHTTAAMNWQDTYARLLAYFGNGKTAEVAPGWNFQLIHDGAGLHDRMITIGKAMFEAEREKARTSPLRDIFGNTLAKQETDRSAPPSPGAVRVSDQTIAPAAAPHEAVHEEAANQAAQGTSTPRRHGPTGRPDDPIFIYSTDDIANALFGRTMK